MRALVTGSAGFLGRHMVRALRARGYEVIGRDLVDGRDALDYFARANETLDLVVHAAAAEPHRAAIDGNAMNLVRNLHLDSAMFEWAVRTGTRVLYLSSSAAYPVGMQMGYQPYRLHETDALVADRPVSADVLAQLPDLARLGPDAAYGWTKLTGEKMAVAAGERIPVHVVRPFSGYGEDQGPDWPFGAFIARARARLDPFTIWGDGTQVRDWIHIDDVVNGALVIVEADYREPVNLCTGEGTSMAELVELICQQVGYAPELELHLDKPAGVAYRVGDPTRLLQYYEPQVSLAEGVKRALG